MNTIISPSEVMALAFTLEESSDPSIITTSDIAIAESRYLLPIIGQELYTKLLNGEYVQLKTEYIAPQVAAWTRYVVEPMLAKRCGVCHGENIGIVDGVVLKRLRMTAMAFSKRLTMHLNTLSANYAEYDPLSNPLNRCSIDGNIVQIH